MATARLFAVGSLRSLSCSTIGRQSFSCSRRLSRNFTNTSFNPKRQHQLSTEYILQHYVVERRGDPGYGSREYMLVPPSSTATNGDDDDNNKKTNNDNTEKVAALLAHRNMMFGARTFSHSGGDNHSLQVCHKLIEAALQDCAAEGEQPQAIASLAGLCDYVQECLSKNFKSNNPSADSFTSPVLEALYATDRKGYEAVQAIATGIPREGHSVVGIGTYRDGEMGWKAIAKEFVDLQLSPEVELYKQNGAEFVGIEHLADKNPDYLQTAGGAMARLFFV